MKSRDLDRLPDRDLVAELNVMSNAIDGDEATYGLVAGDTLSLTSKLSTFVDALDDLDLKTAAATSAYGTRDTTRAALVEDVRMLMKKIRLGVGNDPEKLGAVGLDVYDQTPTAAPMPETAPLAVVDYEILKHIIRFRDAANPDKRGKPKGMLGAEIWRKVGGDPPAKDDDYQMVTLDTASPHVIFYDMEDAGKKVWYRLRWVATSGEKGGWSEVVEATVNG